MTRIKIGRLGNKAGGTGVLWDDVTRRLHLGKSASLKKSISVFRSCGGGKKKYKWAILYNGFIASYDIIKSVQVI